MISLQTNIDSLNAQNNLGVDNSFQSKTIQQLTSGYRINSSGDDAAGLAIANGYRDNISELTQGVANANDGVSQLQIIDGGLSNISTILDRMKTLATESASGTFTGSRATLDQEYQGLVTEITRQASNINLNAGGSFNSALNVYVGGAHTSANANVSIDLSGANNAVDATSLGLTGTSLLGGGTGIIGNTLQINTPNAAFVKGTGGTDDQTFSFHVINSSGAATDVTATVTATQNGSSLSQVLNSLNNQLSSYGINAGVDSNGALQFSGTTAFSVTDNGSIGSGTNLITNSADSSATGHGTAVNASNYTVAGATTYTTPAANETEALKFTTASGYTVTANIAAGDNLATALTDINTATAAFGIYAVKNAAGTGISFQSSSAFTVNDHQTGTGTAAAAVFGTADTTATDYAATAPTSSNSANAAIAAINSAIQSLGTVQGSVGAGENKLQYAINLANSQITSFSAAESQIRDANVAADAANLTKSQVLTQTSIAAMAQANAEPQSVLKLLQ